MDVGREWGAPEDGAPDVASGRRRKPDASHARGSGVAGADCKIVGGDKFGELCWAVAEVLDEPAEVVKEVMGMVGKLEAVGAVTVPEGFLEEAEQTTGSW